MATKRTMLDHAGIAPPHVESAPERCRECGSAAFPEAWARPCTRCGKYMGYEAIPYYGRTGVSFAGSDEMESGEVLRCLACRAIVRTEDCEPVWARCCDACGFVGPTIEAGSAQPEWQGDAA